MKKLAAVISASLVLASTPSLAEVYVGAKAGKSWLDDACTSSTACDDDSSTVGAFVGYEMWDFLSLEAGYDYLGRFTGAGLNDEKVQAYTLAPKLSLPVTDAISLYGKVGGAFVDYGSKDDYSYLGAAGVEFGTNQNVSVRLEYQTLTDVNNDLVRAEANSATLGVVYKFGSNEEAVAAPVVVEEMVEEVVEEVPVVEEPVIVTKTFATQRLGTESFEVNSSKLNEESRVQLDELVEFLNTYPQANVEVVGYTDTSGAASYNQALSEKRAESVASALVEQGIEASRISARGEGENNPIVSNETLEGRQQNRRVEIIVPEFEYQVQQ